MAHWDGGGAGDLCGRIGRGGDRWTAGALEDSAAQQERPEPSAGSVWKTQ